MTQMNTFRGVRDLLGDTSDVRRGDLADQASNQTGGIEVAVMRARASRIDLLQRRIFQERMIRGIEDECMECDDQIPPARRRAEPYAIRCCKCQEEFDKSGSSN